MTDQELDEQVAERVFGWEPRTVANARLPCFANDVSADYLVMHHVRVHWSIQDRMAFSDELLQLWNDESLGVEHALQYQPGDYSRAALAVVTKKGGA